MKKVYNKLVRDKIPEIIEQSGKLCEISVLSDEEYLTALDKKLNEELQEFRQSGEIEELADILEVVYAIAQAKGYSIERLQSLREEKKTARGAFDKKLFLKWVKENKIDK